MIPYLPLNEINAQYESDIEAAVKRILCRGWYILGEECSAFEREYAQYIGTQHCIGCGNGYDALWLIFNAYKFTDGISSVTVFNFIMLFKST